MSGFYKFLFFLLFLIPFQVWADGPNVTSFTVSPSAVDSGYYVNLSWSIDSSNGSDLTFFCPDGIKIFKSDGSLISCNSRISVSSSPSDTASFNFINVSGSVKTIQVRIYPKDLNNVYYDSNFKDVYLSVNTAPHPITDFSYSITGSTIKLNWIANYIDGVNLQFDCNSNVRFYNSGETTPLACGQPAFSASQSANGTASFTFTNLSSSDISLRAIVMPVVTTGSYDASHALSLNLSIPAKAIEPEASINYFSALPTQIFSGEPITFSWSASETSGVNFQFICNSYVSVQTSTTSEKLPCNSLASSQIFAPVSTTTFYFTNNSNSSQVLSIYLFPQNKDGTYNGIKSKKIDIVVGLNKPSSIISQTIPTAPATATQTTQPVQTSGPAVFTVYLEKGARNKQVEALQKFLAKDKQIYPEGLVTGYFGGLTEAAVKRFQAKYSIETLGVVGPKTRAKLNSLQ